VHRRLRAPLGQARRAEARRRAGASVGVSPDEPRVLLGERRPVNGGDS